MLQLVLREAVNNFVSTDGGLSFNQIAHPSEDKGAAYSIKATSEPIRTGAPALGEVTFNSYYKKLDPEFSSYQDINQTGTKKYGAGINIKPMLMEEHLTISARHDIQELDDISRGNLASRASIGAEKTATSMLQANYVHPVRDNSEQDDGRPGRPISNGVKGQYFITGEYRHQESERRIVGLESETNYDADIWALRTGYQISKRLNVFAEEQHTASGDRNHQTTAGGTFRFIDQCMLRLQGTTGTKGESGLIGLDTDVGNKSTVYTSFSQTAAQTNGRDTFQSTAIAGASTQVTEDTRVYSQQEYKTTKDQETKDKSESEGTVLGLSSQVLEKLKVSLSFERSLINEITGGQTKRMAHAISTKYIDKDKLSLSSGFELRLDDGLQERNEYLVTNSINYKIDRDFTFLGKANQSWTENKTTDKTEARFKEHSTGIAYRPVKHDKLNLLGKYTFQDDWYPQNQTGLGTDMSQINHAKAHIYGVEGSYQISERCELVEKVAKKILREKVGPRDYVKSETYLNIHRLNYRIIKKWELGAEYRVLTQKLAEDRKTGYLLEVMYNVHEHISVGVGYNFTDFSDDLTAKNDYSVKGAFLRLIGKF